MKYPTIYLCDSRIVVTVENQPITRIHEWRKAHADKVKNNTYIFHFYHWCKARDYDARIQINPRLKFFKTPILKIVVLFYLNLYLFASSIGMDCSALWAKEEE